VANFRDIYAEALASELDLEVDLLTSPNKQPSGDRAVYRAVYRSMEIHGLPAELEVNGAQIYHVQGPVLSQQTEMSQRGGFPLAFDKCMTRGVEIGAGHWLTVVQIEVMPLPDELGSAIFASRDQAQEAVAFISSVLDERVAQELLAEDLLVLDGSKPVASADMHELVRHFLPYEVTDIEEESLDRLDGSEQPRHVKTAARWYLRGAQAGPGVDGVMFFWFAVEALVGTSKKVPIEKALRRAGRDPADQAIGIGKLHGIRSAFVHDKPDSDPPPKSEVRQAFYDLEAIVKTLLRHALRVDSTWPAHAASMVFDPPWAERIQSAWREPSVEFHEALPGSVTEPVEGLSWGQMLPALNLKAEVEVTGGQDQDANRVRRLVEIALNYFGDPDLEKFPVEIKRFDDKRLVADCRADRLVVSSQIVSPDDHEQAFRLMAEIHVFVGRCLLERRGISTAGAGGFLHGILAGWVFVHCSHESGVPEELMVVNPLPPNPRPFDVGEQVGAGAAGSDGNLENAEDCIVVGDTPQEHAEAKAAFDATIQELRKLNSPIGLVEYLQRQGDSA
jgi:hypothetical protein